MRRLFSSSNNRFSPQLDHRIINEAYKIAEYINSRELEKSIEIASHITMDKLPNISTLLKNRFELNTLIKLLEKFPNTLVEFNENQNIFQISDKNHENEPIALNNITDYSILNTLINDISYPECSQFINFLSRYPMLGLENEIGRKIFNYICNSPKKEINEIELYRIRTPDNPEDIPFVELEMFEPQYGTTEQNRFSSVGINPLYLSDNISTALLEKALKETDKYCYIHVKLITRLTVLDITNLDIPLYDFCHKTTDKKNRKMHKEYLIPNFIADCSRFFKFKGIAYNSVHNQSSKNYVLFHTSNNDFDIIELVEKNYK